MSNFIPIVLTICATVIGQLLTKQGMLVAGDVPKNKAEIVVFLFRNMFLNPFILTGLIFAVLAAMSWMVTLSKTSLSYAYPFMSIAFPLVLLFSSIFFHESVPMLRWLGLGIILFGLVIVARS